MSRISNACMRMRTTRQIDLVQLEQIAATYPSRERFLTELTLDPPDATSAEAGVPLRDEDYLILSTIHSAKGQEWKSVFLLNVVDGCIPSDLATGASAEIEEERRLLYVAMTRAKDRLHLIVPQRFFTHGQHARGDRHVICRAQPLHPRRAHALVRAQRVAARRRAATPGLGRRPGRRSTSARGCAACGDETVPGLSVFRRRRIVARRCPDPGVTARRATRQQDNLRPEAGADRRGYEPGREHAPSHLPRRQVETLFQCSNSIRHRPNSRRKTTARRWYEPCGRSGARALPRALADVNFPSHREIPEFVHVF